MLYVLSIVFMDIVLYTFVLLRRGFAQDLESRHRQRNIP